MSSIKTPLLPNEQEFVDDLILQIRLGVSASEQENRMMMRRYGISVYDLDRVMQGFKEQAMQLKDSDLIFQDQVDESETGRYDDETEMILAINRSIHLLSPEERAEMERTRKRGDKIAAYAMIGILVFVSIIALLSRLT